jgi:3-oxoacyl-[acyl-carrier protein] reductase
MTRNLSDKVAVVTGSSGGIGRAIALELARRGAAVIVHGYRNIEGLQQTARLLKTQRVDTLAITADLTETESCKRLVDTALKWREGIDIWVNNAGADILTGDVAKESFENKLQRLWNVDVKATILLGRLAGRAMQMQVARSSRPAIVNVGWDQAFDGIEGDAGMLFGPTKAAVMAFSQSLAQSLSPAVRVNCVAPGWIRTKWGNDTSEYWNQRAIRESLSARWGTPDDVAATVGFVVSPEADFLNGQIIPVNGGQRCYADSRPVNEAAGQS